MGQGACQGLSSMEGPSGASLLDMDIQCYASSWSVPVATLA